jgi:hypothetical protein
MTTAKKKENQLMLLIIQTKLYSLRSGLSPSLKFSKQTTLQEANSSKQVPPYRPV